MGEAIVISTGGSPQVRTKLKGQQIALAILLGLLIPPVSHAGISTEAPSRSPADTSSRPAIEFVYPKANDRIGDYPIFMETHVSNFKLSQPVQYWGAVQKGDEFIGHIHYTLDDSPIFATKETKVVFGKPADNSLPMGQHWLKAELVNVNHESLNPRVYAEIPIHCERLEQKDNSQSTRTIPIDDRMRQQIQVVEQQLQDVQRQLSQLKDRMRDAHNP